MTMLLRTVCLVLFATVLVVANSPAWSSAPVTETIGHGDGRIHVIPTLSNPSVKNGEKLTISAVVKAQAGVAKVEARIVPAATCASAVDAYLHQLMNPLAPPVADGPLAMLDLKPGSMNLGGASADGKLGLWQAEWTGNGLAEGYYDVFLTVTDRTGHVFTDHSLRFSDPIAGNNVVGGTVYPDGGMKVAGDIGRERGMISAVVDVAAGYAYFGTYTTPGRVVNILPNSSKRNESRKEAIC